MAFDFENSWEQRYPSWIVTRSYNSLKYQRFFIVGGFNTENITNRISVSQEDSRWSNIQSDHSNIYSRRKKKKNRELQERLWFPEIGKGKTEERRKGRKKKKRKEKAARFKPIRASYSRHARRDTFSPVNKISRRPIKNLGAIYRTSRATVIRDSYPPPFALLTLLFSLTPASRPCSCVTLSFFPASFSFHLFAPSLLPAVVLFFFLFTNGGEARRRVRAGRS